MVQVRLFVLGALLALLAVLVVPGSRAASVYRRDEGHVVSDSSSDSSESNVSEAGETAGGVEDAEDAASDASTGSNESHQSHHKHHTKVPDQEDGVDPPPRHPRPADKQGSSSSIARPALPEAASSAEQAAETEEQDDNDALPPYPISADSSKKVYPGQTWESQFKHGVAPAKLPAQENDNAHGYRHSIIHPYGDDLHA